MNRPIKELKRLALLKWDFLITHPGESAKFAIPELEKEIATCAFCTDFMEVYLGNCGKCPVQINGRNCNDATHPYRCYVINPNSLTATVVRDLILSIPDDYTINE